MAVYAAGFFLMFGFSFAYNMTPPSPPKCDPAPLRSSRDLSDDRRHLHRAAVADARLASGPSALGAFVWCGALVGVALKLFLPGRFDRIALGVYLALGWSAIVAIKPLVAALPTETLALIVVGGLIYSVGVAFYLWHSLKFQNAIWHAFVAARRRLPFRRRRLGGRPGRLRRRRSKGGR